MRRAAHTLRGARSTALQLPSDASERRMGLDCSTVRNDAARAVALRRCCRRALIYNKHTCHAVAKILHHSAARIFSTRKGEYETHAQARARQPHSGGGNRTLISSCEGSRYENSEPFLNELYCSELAWPKIKKAPAESRNSGERTPNAGCVCYLPCCPVASSFFNAN